MLMSVQRRRGDYENPRVIELHLRSVKMHFNVDSSRL